MKELLEEYILEAMELRNQAEFLARLVSVLHEELTDMHEDDEYMPVTVAELKTVTVTDIKIEEGVVHFG